MGAKLTEQEARRKLAEQLASVVIGSEHGDDVQLGPYIAETIADAIAEYCDAITPAGRSSLTGGQDDE